MCETKTFLRPIGEVADTNPEVLPVTTQRSARFRYIDLGAVDAGFINWNAVLETTFGAAPSRARRVVRPGDALFGTVRPNLKSHGFVEGNGSDPLIASTGFSVIRAREGVSHPAYLFHSIMSGRVTAQAVRDAIGSSYPAVNDADVNRFLIYSPPIRHQEKIAEILDTLDTAMQETEAIIAKLQSVKQGLLHDLLARGIDANGELRPPQAEAPHLYKQSPLGWIPADWQTERLADVTTLITSGSRGWAACYADDGDIFVRSQNVRMGHLCLADLQHVVPPAGSEGQRTRLEGLDLLITITGNGVGNVAHMPEDWTGTAFVSQHVGLVRFLDPNLARLVTQFLVRGAPGNLQLLDSQYGQSKPGLSLENLRSLRVPIPPIHERAMITERLASAQERIHAEQLTAHRLATLKSGLMDDLLTGRVRVTPLLDGTA